MYAILNLDDFRSIEVAKNDDGATLLFTDEKEALEYADTYFQYFQVIKIEEE